MPSRRQIREAAVQFLYSADLEGGAPAADYRETFWDLLTVPDRRKLLHSTFRALEHITQGRVDRLLELSDRAPNALARLSASAETANLKKELQDMLRTESQWTMQWEKIVKLPLHDVDNDAVVDQLESALSTLYAIDRAVTSSRLRFQQDLADHPSLQPLLEPALASIRRLQRISDRVQMLENPQDHPEQSDLKHICSSKTELLALRRETDHMVDVVLENKVRIDETLASIVENFAPERIDPVDRAILRLSASELLTRPEMAPGILINEAVDLAKKFGSSDSGRFVNGILDQIAKQRV
ncbi:MAG: transcription antitermination factor NusB [Verrucomicrobiota bacterium]|jgi:N utilization substance protein B